MWSPRWETEEPVLAVLCQQDIAQHYIAPSPHDLLVRRVMRWRDWAQRKGISSIMGSMLSTLSLKVATLMAETPSSTSSDSGTKYSLGTTVCPAMRGRARQFSGRTF